MKEFICEKCGRKSYSADLKSRKDCSYCNPKAVVILNGSFIDILRNLEPTPILLIIDRRQQKDRRKEMILQNSCCDRRIGKDRRYNTGNKIAYLFIR